MLNTKLTSPNRDRIRRSYRDLRDHRSPERLRTFATTTALAVCGADPVATAEARKRIAQALRWDWKDHDWAGPTLRDLASLLDTQRLSAPVHHPATPPKPADTPKSRVIKPKTTQERAANTRRARRRRSAIRRLSQQLNLSPENAANALRTLNRAVDLQKIHAALKITLRGEFLATLRPGDAVSVRGARGTLQAVDTIRRRALVRVGTTDTTRWCPMDALQPVDSDNTALTEIAATLLHDNILPAVAQPTRARLLQALIDGLHESAADILNTIPPETRSRELRAVLAAQRSPVPLPVGRRQRPPRPTGDKGAP